MLGCVPAVPTVMGPSRALRMRDGDRVRAGELAVGAFGGVSAAASIANRLQRHPNPVMVVLLYLRGPSPRSSKSPSGAFVGLYSRRV